MKLLGTFRRKPKVFLSLPICFGLLKNKYYENLAKVLRELNLFILNKDITSRDKLIEVEKKLKITSKKAFKININLIKKADIVLADVSYPSTGVGFEICFALLNNKRVICFSNIKKLKNVSIMITGNTLPNFTFFTYVNFIDLKNTIKEILYRNSSRGSNF
ncbi:MAG: nucleoside 2-deoxyribosyltransferase [Candidatus Aenigmatarchaeota archaeon]